MAWEYKVIERTEQMSQEELDRTLNELGRDDWELAQYTIGKFAIFKRKLTGPTEATAKPGSPQQRSY